MCGIAGMFDRTGRPIDRAVLARMTDTLAHRGPDGSRVWIEGQIGLGHRRLAIRDLSAAAHQPMQDPTGRVAVTYNSPVMKSLIDQSVSGATMITSIAGLPSMFATMAIARAASN